MEIHNITPAIKDVKAHLNDGYSCIYYENDGNDNMFTVYLKNFHTEKVKVLKFQNSDASELKLFIDQLTL